MKSSRTGAPVVLLPFLALSLTILSCSKNEPVVNQVPTVTTDPISAITQTSAISGGNITSGGGGG